MEGKRINAEMITDYLPHLKKGDKITIVTELLDIPKVILNARVKTPTNRLGPFWDEMIANKGTYKGYYIITENGITLPEFQKELSKYVKKV